MWMTISQFYEMYHVCNNVSKIATMCREGKLDAHKNKSGIWLINTPMTEEVFDAHSKIKKLEAEKYKLKHKIRQLDKEILSIQDWLLENEK